MKRFKCIVKFQKLKKRLCFLIAFETLDATLSTLSPFLNFKNHEKRLSTILLVGFFAFVGASFYAKL